MKRQSASARAQGIVEYALLIVLITVITVLILSLLGVSVRDMYCAIAGPLGLDDTCTHDFHDDFDGGLDAWTVVRGTWSTKDGQLLGGIGEGRILANDVDSNDYRITLDTATLEQGNGYGIYFRATNPPDFDGYSFQYDPGYGAFIFRRWVKGTELPPMAVSRAPGYDWLNVPRKVELQVQGDTFTAYVDGQPVLTATDDTYAQGTVGLRTWDNTRIKVDDFTIDPIR